MGVYAERPGTWKSADIFKSLCMEKLGFRNIAFRRNAEEKMVKDDFKRLKERLDADTDMVLIFISTHATGMDCIFLNIIFS